MSVAKPESVTSVEDNEQEDKLEAEGERKAEKAQQKESDEPKNETELEAENETELEAEDETERDAEDDDDPDDLDDEDEDELDDENEDELEAEEEEEVGEDDLNAEDEDEEELDEEEDDDIEAEEVDEIEPIEEPLLEDEAEDELEGVPETKKHKPESESDSDDEWSDLEADSKIPRKWKGFGSEVDVDNELVVDSRPLISIRAYRFRQYFGDQWSFEDSPKGPNFTASFPSEPAENYPSIQTIEVDKGIQVIPGQKDASIQTGFCFKRNKIVQYSTQSITEKNVANIIGSKGMVKFIRRVMPRLDKILQQNEMVDLLQDDYRDLKSKRGREKESLLQQDYQNYSDLKGRTVTYVFFHQAPAELGGHMAETPAKATETPETPEKETPETPATATETDSTGEKNIDGQPASFCFDMAEPPAKTTKPPATATETPAKATETPATATETPAKATKTPAKATETPATATETPTTATETPAKATETPATATETPATATEMDSTGEKKIDGQPQSLVRDLNDPAHPQSLARVLNDPAHPQQTFPEEDEIEQEHRLNEEYKAFLEYEKEMVEVLKRDEPPLPTMDTQVDEFDALITEAYKNEEEEEEEEEEVFDFDDYGDFDDDDDVH